MPKKAKIKKSNLKKAITATALATSIITGSAGWYLSSSKNQIQVPYYEVKRVLDGDTFETKEGQFIRLASTHAPEKGLCGSQEAKQELENLILNQPLYLKVLFRDQFNRLISLVYTKNKFINEEITKSGWVLYHASAGSPPPELKIASQKARDSKLGIYGHCIQTSNPKNSNCTIKANNHWPSKNKYYRFPGCGQYNNTQVETYLGDQWFCSETEAQKAGYTKGKDCFNHTFQPTP